MQDSNLTCRRIGEAGCIVASLIKVHANGLADLKLLFPVGSHSLNWFLEELTEYHKSNRKSFKRGIASYIRLSNLAPDSHVLHGHQARITCRIYVYSACIT